MPTRAHTLQVLVVDDDADMRLYMAGCLHGFGPYRFTVTEAAGGAEALVLARTCAFDLVISDVVMPGLDGPGLCHALKTDAVTAAVPFLLVSGEPHASLSEADGFLAKPFNAAGLRAEVERLLGTA